MTHDGSAWPTGSGDDAANLLSCLTHRIVGEVSIALRRPGLGVT
jgi:hypothetical protein